MAQKTKDGKVYYSDSDRFLYHAKQNKRGSKRKDGTPLTDYARGKHGGCADTIKEYQKRRAYQWKKSQGLLNK